MRSRAVTSWIASAFWPISMRWATTAFVGGGFHRAGCTRARTGGVRGATVFGPHWRMSRDAALCSTGAARSRCRPTPHPLHSQWLVFGHHDPAAAERRKRKEDGG